jgi:hypothetical protein
MNSGPLQRSANEIASAPPEVEFALVLARTIDAVNSDPEQLRSAIYELARQKLQQLSDDDPAEKTRLMHALEVAISGVEGHMKGATIEKFPVPSTTALLPGTHPQAAGLAIASSEGKPLAGRRDRYAWDIESQPVRKRLRWASSTAFRFIAMLVFIAAIAGGVVALRHGTDIASFRPGGARVVAGPKVEPANAAPAASEAQAQTAPAADTAPKRLLPTAYGVYAENGGKLYELSMLQGRAPDARVAISAAILHPSGTVLPDGHVNFVVFRGGVDNGPADLIEVHLIARVKQATSFDAAGKPVVSAKEEAWVIRNIAIPYRAAPIKDEPRMYEVEPREADTELSPGRYALVIKGQAFDFSIDGTVTDKRHCLERITAANGVFYSECPNP